MFQSQTVVALSFVTMEKYASLMTPMVNAVHCTNRDNTVAYRLYK